jgi:glutathione S-transferase
MGIAFRFQYLDKEREACDALINRIPDPIRRERRRDIIYNGVEAGEFKTAVRMWEVLLTDMEKTLGGSRWLADDNYSLADAAYTPYLTRLDHLNLLDWIAKRQRLANWYERIRARPSYDSAIRQWENRAYIDLMNTKGGEVWPRIKRMIDEL